MIVDSNGYYSKEGVLEMLTNGESFTIHKTHKNTEVLIKYKYVKPRDKVQLCYPDWGKIEWKITEGKKIVNSEGIVFDTEIHNATNLDFSKWNNKNQIMVYEEYTN